LSASSSTAAARSRASASPRRWASGSGWRWRLLTRPTNPPPRTSNFLFKSEIDRDVVRRASFVCVDSREELGLEAGDLLNPLETGLILPEAIYELGQVIAGQVKGRRGPEDITLFASQGLALEDMAAARVVYDRAVERDVGREIEF
jgi:ornithine cyclodeaminase/alanine dehydrogenase-like protein (mu-crystallin family)